MAGSVSRKSFLSTVSVARIGNWDICALGAYMITAHVFAIVALYSILNGLVPLQPIIFTFALIYGSTVGVSVGAHRLWSHRSFKANLPLRILLMFLQTLAGQDSILKWVRNHRLHHKYCETDADPHNIKRGFFFSHMGWYLVVEHPEVTKKAETIDLSDIENDSVVKFQKKYFVPLFFLIVHIIPVTIIYYFWVPSPILSFCLNNFRHVLFIQLFSLGNSVAHSWTRKPYETTIGPADVSWLSLIIAGEGWHNFHHVFPWDYRSTDVGLYLFNFSSIFIDFFAKFGWAYDLKTVSDEVIMKRAGRTGDGSHPANIFIKGENETSKVTKAKISNIDKNQNSGGNIGIGPGPWGWGDPDVKLEFIQNTVTVNNGRSYS